MNAPANTPPAVDKPLTITNLALEMAALRRQIETLDKAVKAKKNVLDRAENLMLGLLDKAGVASAAVDNPDVEERYNFAAITTEKVGVTSKDDFMKFVFSPEGGPSFLPSSVLKGAAQDYRSKNGALPPGVVANSFRELSWRTTKVISKTED